MLKRCKNYSRVIIVGPQRSGTNFATKQLAQDLGLRYVGQYEFGYPDDDPSREFKALLRDAAKIAVHAIQLTPWINDLEGGDTIAIYIVRKRSEILASENRVNWSTAGFPLQKQLYSIRFPQQVDTLQIFERNSDMVNYFWDNFVKNDLKIPYVEFRYDDFSSSEGWIPPHNRIYKNYITLRKPKTERFDLGGVGKGGDFTTVNNIEDCDVRCDLLEVDKYIRGDGWVEEIRMVHTLEHLPPHHFIQFILDLRRKLKSGGFITVVQTDGGEAIRQWVKGSLSFRAMRATLFTPADRLRVNPLNSHVQMWNEEELKVDFEALGFSVTSFNAGTWSFDHNDDLAPQETERCKGIPIKNIGIIATKLTIPRVIHQTWKTEKIPSELYKEKWIESWKEMNGFEYRFWTDEDNRELVREHYPWFLATYDAYDAPIKRADAARYLILAKFGGIYADLDFVRLRRMDWVLDRNDLLLCYQSEGSVGNAFMAASPGHPLLEELVSRLQENANKPVLEATGPGLLTRVALESVHAEELLRSELFFPYKWNDPRKSEYREMDTETLRDCFPEAIAVTHWSGSWL